MSLNTLSEIFTSYEDPLQQCAGQPVILGSEFESMATDVSQFDNIVKTKEELVLLFKEQTKRFTACGANNADERFAVLRKNPANGWEYLITLVQEK